jgi:nucleotide-binding universal stress UspA family protein
MYETILVPLDGSKRAEAILPHVERLTRLCGAEVILLQVVDPPARIEVPEEFDMALHQQQLERLEQRAEEYLRGLQDGFGERGIRARRRIVHGPVVNAILTTAAHEKADLIAIASHGRTGLGQVFYGSVAAGVLHRIDRPLLLIRSREGE